MSTWSVLIRREYWEHRLLWLAPTGVAALSLLAGLFALLNSGEVHLGSSRLPGSFSGFNAENGVDGAYTVFPIAVLLLFVGALTVTLFLLDSLYAERKDRSILFWKSLPVSDTQTVLAKLAVALVITPLGLCVLAVVTHLLALLMLTAFAPAGLPVRLLWNAGAQLEVYGLVFAGTLLNVVWYAPVAAYALLASVLARRSPALIATLPMVAVGVGERLTFGSNVIGSWLGRRLMPRFELAEAVTDPQLWIGAVAAAAVIVAVIRLRRWRDDT